MKSLTEFIKEAMQVYIINEDGMITATDDTIHRIVRAEIYRLGVKANLNHIDVSQVTDMHKLFYNSKFNGNISKWNVSKVIDMWGMFAGSRFNGNISKWNVSNVKNMLAMFYKSKFKGDISKWNVENVEDMRDMFDECPLEKNPPAWYKGKKQYILQQ